AFAVEFLGLVVRTLREPARAVGNVFHHRSGPCPFGGRPGRRPSPPPPAFRKASCCVRLRENARRDNRASRGRSPAHRRIAAPCDPMTGCAGHARYRSDIEEKSLPRLRGGRATRGPSKPTPLPGFADRPAEGLRI